MGFVGNQLQGSHRGVVYFDASRIFVSVERRTHTVTGNTAAFFLGGEPLPTIPRIDMM